MLRYQALLELSAADTVDALTARTVALAQDMGFGLASAVLLRGPLERPSGLHAFGNPPAGYEDAMYSAGDGLRDPLLTQLMARPGHAQYDQGTYARAGASDLWDAQAAFGFRAGMAVSIHAPTHAEAFMLGVDRPDALPSGPDLFLLQANLQMLAMHAQAGALRILAMRAGANPTDQLNRSERAAVQTAGATVLRRKGRLMSISELGASPALASAARKMGARTSADLVLKAVDGGLIHP
jgi:hypothetical protein